jgi:predicted AAA+ superfamily ATPase
MLDQLEQLYYDEWNGKILLIRGDKAYRSVWQPNGWENQVTKSVKEEKKNEELNKNEQIGYKKKKKIVV